jgi:hypothetical protein
MTGHDSKHTGGSDSGGGAGDGQRRWPCADATERETNILVRAPEVEDRRARVNQQEGGGRTRGTFGRWGTGAVSVAEEHAIGAICQRTS